MANRDATSLAAFASALGLTLPYNYVLSSLQARRTNTSSPLGELVDHGCDALTTTVPCQHVHFSRICACAYSSANLRSLCV
jgi:hypothetical protein